jgi:hypothetical protein
MTTIRPRHSQRGLRLGAVAIAAALAGTVCAAAACRATSGAELVPLVELFTSEGCDSCPPADRWLSAQFPPSREAADASILAFHVDYWDRLGWKDRFASPRFTERQYATMRASGATFVFTPQVVVQGRDVPGWQRGAAGTRVNAARKQPPRATIAIDIDAGPDATLAIRSDASVASAPLRNEGRLWLAYTDSGHVSDVKAGENRGVRLEHDHVVRALHGPFAFDANGDVRVAISQRVPAESGTKAAVVAFVQDVRSGDVLQTLTAPVCGAR